LELSKKIKNTEVAESAIAVRNAMNADAQEFNKFLKHYSNETQEEVESQKLAEGKAALKRLFGGG
jgi:uncharacterized protein YeaO (DUF488 family)